MTRTETIELSLIPAVVATAFVAAPWLPMRIALGSLLLIAFVLLLLQGLLRDLSLLAASRRAAMQGAMQQVQCMCVESAVGVTGVLAGIVVLGSGIGHPVDMAGWSWAVCVFAVGATGYAIKDLVFEWNPWSIRREKDHLNIVVHWKKTPVRTPPEGS